MKMKRKKTTRNRKRTMRELSAAPRRMRIRSRKRTKRGLSELFSPETARAAASVVSAGALGGALAGGAHKIIANQKNLVRFGLEGAASFLTYAVLNKPSMAAGMAGAFAALELQPIYTKFLNEDASFADDDAINTMPMFMNEDGDPLTLAADDMGTPVYLNEATGETTPVSDVYLNEDGIYLNEDGIYLNEDDQIYPTYGANTTLY
jgi:hypothetical protein